MTRTYLSFASALATSLTLALAACGGASTASSGPAPVVVPTPAPSPEGAPVAPRVTKAGPNVTPEGVVFNFKTDIKNAQVYLAGSFNGWAPSDSTFLMKDEDGDGIYSITLKLAPGTYQYKYVVDGKWTQDQYAPADAPDGYGGRNSQFDVK